MDLRSLLTTPELGLTLLYGESLLDRQIRWVVPTDLPDPRRYLSGGELVLTGMLWRHEPRDSERFVSALVSAGVAGLGAGDPDRDDIPADLVDACRRHDIPLFAVSKDVAFATITEQVVRRLSAGRSADLAAVLGRHRLLMATGGGLAGVLDLVAEDLGMNCWVLSASGRVIRAAGGELDDQDRSAIRSAALRGGLPSRIHSPSGRSYSVFGVGAVPCAGWLLVFDDDHTSWPPARRDVADELIGMLALERDRLLSRSDAEQELIGAIAQNADGVELSGRLRMLGLPVGGPLAVAVATVQGPYADVVGPAVLVEAVLPPSEHVVWARRGNETIALAEGTDDATLIEHARATVVAIGPGLAGHRLAVGLSSLVRSAEALPGALAEARHAHAAAAGRPEAASVAGPDDLTSHLFLLAATPSEVRRAFCSRLLDPLLSYDEKHNSSLVSTLEVFLACSGSWAKCAAELHLHVNTLRYRIERIEQLTGRDMRQLGDLVDLYLALRLR